MSTYQNISTRLVYSRAERVSDAVVHAVALVAALAAVPVLITLAAVWRGDAAAITGVSIYGATLLAMILCSALYNGLPAAGWKQTLQRLDHTAIYLKIAGTFTPFALLSGGHGGWLLTGIWGTALVGSGLRSFGGPRLRWFSFGLYLAMGWVGVALGWPLVSQLSGSVLALMAAGGVLYSFGTVFLFLDQIPFHTTIWHGFVMTATTLFFVAVMLHLAQTSGTAT